MRKNKKLWSYALAGAMAVSNLSAVAFPITALAASPITITYARGQGASGDLEKNTDTTDDNGKFTAAGLGTVKKTGYHTEGYKVDADNKLTTADDPAKQVTTNDTVLPGTDYIASDAATLTVDWTADEFNLVYELQGGTAGADKPGKKEYDDPLAKPISDPTKANCEFAGWDLDGDLTKAEIDPGAAANDQSIAIDAQYAKAGGESVTATALWYDVYTITYDGNSKDATGTVADTKYNEGMTTVKLDNTGFTNPKATQKGWSTSKSRTSKTFSTTNNPTTDFDLGSTAFKTDRKENVTMYAVWEEKDVWTVSFDENGGTGTVDPIEVIDGDNGKMPENTYKRTGYSLKTNEEWNTKADGKGTSQKKDDVVAISENVTYYSNWEANSYSIVYNANGGKEAELTDTAKYDSEVILRPENTFTHDNATFVGWSEKKNGSGTIYDAGAKEVFNFATGESGDTSVTLYAIWEAKEGTCTINYDNNGGKGEIASAVGVALPHATVGDSDAKAAFTKENYTLMGWSTDSKATKVDIAFGANVPAGSPATVTLYAVWAGDEHTVDFDSSDGTGSMDTQKFVYGTPQKLTKNAFSKEDSKFVGWGESATATTAKYTDEQEISDLDKDIILYAIWEPISEEATDAAKKAAGEATDAAAVADSKAAAAQTAADAANKAAEEAKKNPTDATVAAAKTAADAATKAASEATEAAKAAETAAKAAEAAAKVAGVDADVAEEAKAAAGQATKSAAAAKTAATNATTAAKAATDAASGVAPKAADGSAKDAPAASGTELVDANGNKTGFKVTDANASAPEVEYVGPSDKNATKADIPETQTDLSGNTYKVTSVAANAFEGSKVKTVTIRKNIKKIDPNAFKKSKVKNVKIKSVKLTKKMTKAFKKLKKGGKITVSGKHKAKNKELLNKLSNVKNGKTKVK